MLFGDGYDFQIDVSQKYFLVEVKGIKTNYGGIRFTEKEFNTAKQYKNEYTLVVVSNLISEPKLNLFFNPIEYFQFNKKSLTTHQISYHIGSKDW
jgi:Protein NO VEIN, C-terminal